MGNVHKYYLANHVELSRDGDFEITTYGRLWYRHDPLPNASLLTFPCVEDLGAFVPGLEGLIWRATGRPLYLLGLEKSLHGQQIVDVSEEIYGFSYQVAKAKRRCGYKLVVTVDETVPFTFPCSKTYDTMKEIHDATDIFVASSESAKMKLIGEGISPGRTVVIPRGVDTRRFTPAPTGRRFMSRLGIGGSYVVILFVGRLVWDKGVLDLLRAIRVLTMKNDSMKSRIKVILAGQGPDRRRIQSDLQYLGLREIVHLVGSVDQEEIHLLYQSADIFVLPSNPTANWQDWISHALLEAMASGLAVICTNSGGLRDEIGEAGLSVVPANCFLLANAIARLVEDPVHRRNLGGMARARAEGHFDSRKTGKQLKEVYESL